MAVKAFCVDVLPQQIFNTFLHLARYRGMARLFMRLVSDFHVASHVHSIMVSFCGPPDILTTLPTFVNVSTCVM